jgi:hypothetical protein
MKRFLKTFLLTLFFIGGLLLSCKSSAPITETKEKIVTVKEILRDTILNVEADSSFYQAYIDCVNGKPVIRENEKQGDKPKTKKGKSLQAPKVTIKDNQLSVNCYQEAQNLFFKWREQFIKEFEKEVKVPAPVTVERDFTWWEITQMWIGRIVLFIAGISLIVWAIKKYFKFTSLRP